MSKIKKHQSDWDNLAKNDPLWAVLSDNSKRFNNWELEEFLKTGDKEVALVWENINNIGLPINQGKMLDFGCGVGRLTRSWLKHFNSYTGCDISPLMIKKAKEINNKKAQFIVTNKDLSLLNNNYFDFIYSGIVLQHMPNKKLIYKYLLEFNRILKPNGLLVFQLPSKIPYQYRLQPIRKLYKLLKFIGFSDNYLYNKLKLYPIKMTAINSLKLKKFLEINNFIVKKIESDTYCGPKVESKSYYCQKIN
jgi:ubiquinone/menaquinone biosynthesis C-methylase UbiE